MISTTNPKTQCSKCYLANVNMTTLDGLMNVFKCYLVKWERHQKPRMALDKNPGSKWEGHQMFLLKILLVRIFLRKYEKLTCDIQKCYLVKYMSNNKKTFHSSSDQRWYMLPKNISLNLQGFAFEFVSSIQKFLNHQMLLRHISVQ